LGVVGERIRIERIKEEVENRAAEEARIGPGGRSKSDDGTDDDGSLSE